MEKQLTIAEIVNLPAVQFTRNGLVFPSQTKDEIIPEVGRRVALIRGFAKWAMGAVFREMIKRRDNNDTWANDFAQALAMDPKERREVLAVDSFYSLDSRNVPLSFEHYREAMWGTADGKANQHKRAMAFLRMAHENKWSVSQLRLYIRKASADERDEPLQDDLSLVRYASVFAFRRFAAEELKAMDQMDPDRAALILSDLGEAVEFIEQLKTKAAEAKEPVLAS